MFFRCINIAGVGSDLVEFLSKSRFNSKSTLQILMQNDYSIRVHKDIKSNHYKCIVHSIKCYKQRRYDRIYLDEEEDIRFTFLYDNVVYIIHFCGPMKDIYLSI